MDEASREKLYYGAWALHRTHIRAVEQAGTATFRSKVWKGSWFCLDPGGCQKCNAYFNFLEELSPDWQDRIEFWNAQLELDMAKPVA